MAVEVRRQEGEIDEIVAHGCNLHIEQMDDHGFFIVIEEPNGASWGFWIGRKNWRGHVEIREGWHAPAEGAE